MMNSMMTSSARKTRFRECDQAGQKVPPFSYGGFFRICEEEKALCEDGTIHESIEKEKKGIQIDEKGTDL